MVHGVSYLHMGREFDEQQKEGIPSKEGDIPKAKKGNPETKGRKEKHTVTDKRKVKKNIVKGSQEKVFRAVQKRFVLSMCYFSLAFLCHYIHISAREARRVI